jgi:hypothetical protein
MRQIRSLAAALMALLVLGALGAQAVMAEEGFLPLKTKTFTLHGTTVASLETTGALPPTKCKLVEGSGTFETDKHGKVTLDFFGCESSGFLERSLGDTTTDEVTLGLILFVNALFLICLITATTYGIFVEPNGEVHVEIPALGQLMGEKGAIIGKIEEPDLSSKTTFKGKFEGSKGVQKPTECKDEVGTKKHSLTVETNHNLKPEVASWNVPEAVITTAEAQLLMMT